MIVINTGWSVSGVTSSIDDGYVTLSRGT